MGDKKNETQGTIAPLRNVALFLELVDRVMRRSSGLPGMACFTGFSGYGKTCSAIYAANKYRAFHVQLKSCTTRRSLCTAILAEIGEVPGATIDAMVTQIGRELALSRRPLIVDEADFLIKGGMVELVRDIYESSQATVILIGEERFPEKLRRWERVHGRMLDWVQAQPASLADARHLARLYCRGVEIADDLLAAVHEHAQGSARRIVVNLDRVREAAELASLKKIARAQFQGAFFTGRPPAARSAA